MGVGMADYDLDGKPDLFVTNDSEYNFLFHNLGNKFEEVAFETNVALPEEGISSPAWDSIFATSITMAIRTSPMSRSTGQTFPLHQNTGKGDFMEVTASSGMRAQSMACPASALRSTTSTMMAGRICLSPAGMSPIRPPGNQHR